MMNGEGSTRFPHSQLQSQSKDGFHTEARTGRTSTIMQPASLGGPRPLHFILVDCAPVANPTYVDADFRASMKHNQFICFAIHV